MPQASDELRLKWGGNLGVGEDKAEAHLITNHFVISPHGLIYPPTDFDWEADKTDCWGACLFLIEEWDYDLAGVKT